MTVSLAEKAYPAAPWINKGYALLALRLVDVARARAFVPPALRVVSVLPGKTLGVVYFANYGPGSTLSYLELIVASGLVRYGSRTGFWIQHIYVDSAEALAGGREIWGLPKEMAEFHWERERRIYVEARQDGRLLAQVEGGLPGLSLQVPVNLPAITLLGGKVLSFRGQLRAGLGLSSGKMVIPPESPFASLGLDGPVRTYHYKNMTFTSQAPVVIGQTLAQAAPG